MTIQRSLCVVLVILLTACASPGYYMQAASGQWQLMSARQDVDELLANPSTAPELASQLQTAQQVLKFAESRLGLPANGGYTDYVELEGNAPVWNVIATKEFSIHPKLWCFPVAGCVPYRGYFGLIKARKFAAKLEAGGMDVFVSPAAAYSTLGWFRDPLLSSMLTGSELRLAAHLFHELAHQRLYAKGDGAFNEAYASFVEHVAMQLWLESDLRSRELENWQRMQAAMTDFTLLVGRTREELDELYRSGLDPARMREKKHQVLQGLKVSIQELKTEKWRDQDYFSNWFEKPVNNARLALYNTYEGNRCAFAVLFDEAGGDIIEFHRLAERQSKLQKSRREAWLKETCTAVAPANDL